MQVFELLGAVIAVAVTVGVGIAVHELSHAFVLRAIGIPFDITWFPRPDGGGRRGVGLSGTWAVVTPRRVPRGTPAWGLRLSAIAPLLLVTPFVFVGVGTVPDPMASGSVIVSAATVGWLACALPSPQDFSVFWHANRAVREHHPSSIVK